MQDPYDSSIKAPLMRNRSEISEYDKQFPDHPLSRVRHLLERIQKTMEIAPEVSGAAPYKSQKPINKPKSWWKRW